MILKQPQPTPMIFSLHLIQDGSSTIEDSTLYKFVMGALRYLTIT